HELLIRVRDGEGGLDTLALEIEVQEPIDPPNPDGNRPPMFTSTPRTGVELGELYVHTVSATDPDADRLVFELVVKPAGMGIDAANGLIEWDPAAASVA